MNKFSVAIAAAMFLAGAAPADEPATSPARVTKAGIILSKDTTYIDGPVLDDGTIDYLTAFNALAGKGVTRENNAAMLILTAVEPDRIDFDQARAKAILKAMDLEPAKEVDPTICSFSTFVERAVKAGRKMRPYLEVLINLEDDFHKRLTRAEDYPEMAEWIAAQEKPLSIYIEASKRPRYYIPAVVLKGHSMLDATQMPMAMSVGVRALLVRGSFRFAAGDFENARQDTLAALRLARLQQGSSSSMVRLSGSGSESLACEVLRVWAASGKLTPDQCRQLLRDLAELPEAETQSIAATERFFLLDWAMEIKRGNAAALMQAMLMKFGGPIPVGNLSEVDPNVLLRALNAYCDEIDKQSAMKTYKAKRDAVAGRLAAHQNSGVPTLPAYKTFSLLLSSVNGATETPTTNAFKEAMHGGDAEHYIVRRDGESVEAYSKRIAQLFVGQPIDAQFLGVLESREAKFRMTHIALALAAYRAENGAYPETLAALSPKLLAKLPLDPFSDKEPLYKRDGNGCLLYCVGINLKDDGGAADDIVVRVK